MEGPLHLVNLVILKAFFFFLLMLCRLKFKPTSIEQMEVVPSEQNELGHDFLGIRLVTVQTQCSASLYGLQGRQVLGTMKGAVGAVTCLRGRDRNSFPEEG